MAALQDAGKATVPELAKLTGIKTTVLYALTGSLTAKRVLVADEGEDGRRVFAIAHRRRR